MWSIRKGEVWFFLIIQHVMMEIIDFSKIELLKVLINKQSKYVPMIERMFETASNYLPLINKVFDNYTGHDMKHSISIMQYMYDLISDISKISDLEITCMIFAALLHDTGMIATENEIKLIKSDKKIEDGRKYSVILNSVTDENFALQEYIRPIHGKRSLNFVMSMDKSLFEIPGDIKCSIQEEVANICCAHTMDREWITKNLEKEQIMEYDDLNSQFIAILLRIGDLLDIDQTRAPMELYQLISPHGFGDEEWQQHQIVRNKKKVYQDSESNMKYIMFNGQCTDYNIHRKLLSYFSYLEDELAWSENYSRNSFETPYKLNIRSSIENRIVTKGFEISNLEFSVDYQSISNLLMGESIYSNKKYGIREIIQNSIDACRLMIEEAKTLEKYRYDSYIPKIQLIFDYYNNRLIIKDNGIGMTYEVFTRYFLSIGKSFYKSKEFLYQDKKCPTIGRFGIGFLASFMLSDKVTVETKHYHDKEGFSVEVESSCKYLCKRNKVEYVGESGTAIILKLNSVLKIFSNRIQDVLVYVSNTFLANEIEFSYCNVNTESNISKIKLYKLEELITEGYHLDCYLNGIAAELNIDTWLTQFDSFSDIISAEVLDSYSVGYFIRNIIICNYDTSTEVLYRTDTVGKDLDEYIQERYIMIMKIKGIIDGDIVIKDERDYDIDPNFLYQDAITAVYYLPIKFDKVLLSLIEECFENLNKQLDSDSFLSMLSIKDKNKKYLRHFKNIIEQTKTEKRSINMIGFEKKRIWRISDESYMMYSEPDDRRKCKSYDVFLQGVRLDLSNIKISSGLHAIKCNNLILNINRNDITPNIARTELVDSDMRKIENALNRALHLWLIDNCNDADIKNTLVQCVDDLYPFDDKFSKL